MYVKNLELTDSFSNNQKPEMYQRYVDITLFKMSFGGVGIGVVEREMRCDLSVVADLCI